MKVHSEDDLIKWRRQWANYHVLLAMTKLGFFDLMADGEARTADTLAQQLEADSRAIDICGRILAEAGLVSYENGKFQITQNALDLQTPLRERNLEWRRLDNYARLLETIKTGQPVISTTGGVVEENEADARQFLTALHRQSAKGANEAAKLIVQVWNQMPDKAASVRILDLGGGHGRYAAAFAQALPDSAVTLFDRPIVTRIARELSGAGFDTRNGDFLKDDLGGPYDIVFMAGIVSGIAIEEVSDLFERVRNVTQPQGAVVIQDIFVDPDSQLSPASAIDFHLTLLVENEHGRFRTVPELAELLTAARFPSHRHVAVAGEDFGYLVGSGPMLRLG